MLQQSRYMLQCSIGIFTLMEALAIWKQVEVQIPPFDNITFNDSLIFNLNFPRGTKLILGNNLKAEEENDKLTNEGIIF
jgi:hypothetical protein